MMPLSKCQLCGKHISEWDRDVLGRELLCTTCFTEHLKDEDYVFEKVDHPHYEECCDLEKNIVSRISNNATTKMSKV